MNDLSVRKEMRCLFEKDGMELGQASEEWVKNDFSLVAIAITQNPHALQHVSKSLQDHDILVLIAVRIDASALQFASERVRNLFEVIKTAYLKNTASLQFAGPAVLGNEKLVALLRDPMTLETAGPELQDNWEAVCFVLKKDGLLLKHASPRLKSDIVMVRVAVCQNGLALEYADPEFQDDFHTVFLAINQNPKALSLAGKKMRINQILVKNAKYYESLAEKKLRGNQIVVPYVNSCESTFHYSDPSLPKDKQLKGALAFENRLIQKMRGNVIKQKEKNVVKDINSALGVITPQPELMTDIIQAREAVMLIGGYLRYLSEELRDNEEIVLLAVENDGMNLAYASARLKNSMIVVDAALLQNPDAICFIGDFWQNEPDLIKKFVAKNGRYLQYASETLKNDIDTVLTAIFSKPTAILFVGNALRKSDIFQQCMLDRSFMQETMNVLYEYRDDWKNILSKNGLDLDKANSILQNTRSFVIIACSQNPMAFKYASPRLQNNFDIVKHFVTKNGLVLEYASEDLRDHIEIGKLAIYENSEAIKFASARVQAELQEFYIPCREVDDLISTYDIFDDLQLSDIE